MPAPATIELNRDLLCQIEPADRIDDGVLAAASLFRNLTGGDANRLVAKERLNRLKDNAVIDVELDVHRRNTLIIIVTDLGLLCLTSYAFALMHYK